MVENDNFQEKCVSLNATPPFLLHPLSFYKTLYRFPSRNTFPTFHTYSATVLIFLCLSRMTLRTAFCHRLRMAVDFSIDSIFFLGARLGRTRQHSLICEGEIPKYKSSSRYSWRHTCCGRWSSPREKWKRFNIWDYIRIPGKSWKEEMSSKVCDSSPPFLLAPLDR